MSNVVLIIALMKVMGLIYPVLKSLKIDLKQKVVLFLLFSLGTISIVCNVVKSAVFLQVPFVHGFIWASTEITVAIICASIPTLRPLFFKKAWVWRHKGEGDRSRLTVTHDRKSDPPYALERRRSSEFDVENHNEAGSVETAEVMELDKMGKECISMNSCPEN